MTIDVAALERDPNWKDFVHWARQIGGGFHPDNRAADYDPPIADPVAYDDAMDRAFAAGSPDPYLVAMAVVPPVATPELRRLVFRALANAAENGYELDESNAAEAIEVMDQDADVEAYCQTHFVDPASEAVPIVADLVREWRAGARE